MLDDPTICGERIRGKSDLYRQCDLVQGGRVVVTWVENSLAFTGKWVAFKDDNAGLDGMWRIEKVYKGQALTGDQLDEVEGAHRHHRKRTDI